MGYIGMCCCEGYGFQAVYSSIGYKNQSVWVQNRVSFFTKLRKPRIATQKYQKMKSASLNFHDSASTALIDDYHKTVLDIMNCQKSVSGKQLVQNRGDLRSLLQYRVAKFSRTSSGIGGSRVPAAHPHPEIPKVPLPGVAPGFLRFGRLTWLLFHCFEQQYSYIMCILYTLERAFQQRFCSNISYWLHFHFRSHSLTWLVCKELIKHAISQ